MDGGVRARRPCGCLRHASNVMRSEGRTSRAGKLVERPIAKHKDLADPDPDICFRARELGALLTPIRPDGPDRPNVVATPVAISGHMSIRQ